MIDFVHELQKPADLAGGESFTGEPVQIIARQIGNDRALVFAKGHFAGEQQAEIFGVHENELCPRGVCAASTGGCANLD